MKTSILISILSLALITLSTPSYAAICPCDAPPTCGPARPSSCPLRMNTIHCGGDLNAKYSFSQNIDPGLLREDRPILLDPSGPFEQGSAIQLKNGLMVYSFGANLDCHIEIVIDRTKRSSSYGNYEGTVESYVCDGVALDIKSTCIFEY